MVVLEPSERPYVHRRSSIDQFANFLSVEKQGGPAPVIFDQLDGITCDTIRSHPVAVSLGGDIGYLFPEGHCTYVSDKYIYTDKETVEQEPLPAIFGGTGEFYETFVRANAFINFDNNTSLGVTDKQTFRTGLSYVLAEDNLPAIN